MKPQVCITAEIAKSLFTVDEASGSLLYRGQLFEDGAPRKVITHMSSTGYVMAKMFGRTYAVHRVIFAVTHGYWPPVIDHMDRVKTNNSPRNLRSVTHSLNNQNRPARTTSTSKYLGVFWDSGRQKWRAQIQLGEVRKCVGRYASEDEAALRYNQAALDLYGPNAFQNIVGPAK